MKLPDRFALSRSRVPDDIYCKFFSAAGHDLQHGKSAEALRHGFTKSNHVCSRSDSSVFASDKACARYGVSSASENGRSASAMNARAGASGLGSLTGFSVCTGPPISL